MKRRLLAISLIAAISTLVIGGSLLYGADKALPGKDIIYTKPVKSVIFSHKAHVEAKGLSCDACHSGLFEPQALKSQEMSDFNMNSLYKGKYCGGCHNGRTAFASNTQCARCHIGVKGYDAFMKREKGLDTALRGPQESITIGEGDSAVLFSHQSHEKSRACGDCHSAIFPMKRGRTKITMDALYQGKFCGSCHDGSKAFSAADCARCHSKMPMPKADLVYRVKDLSPVMFSHKSHTKTYGCNDCHTKFFPMKKTSNKMNMETMNKGKFCGGCHNGTIATAVSNCGKCHRA